MRSLSVGATGMYAQQMNVEVIANNIANMGTSGYKRQRAEFQDLMYQNIRMPGAQSASTGEIMPSGLQLGSGVKVDSVTRMHTQGTMEVTDNSLDVAVNGNGYFPVQLPSGETAYTRAGTLKMNQDGLMITNEGYQLNPGITIPPDATDITINKNGEVWVKLGSQMDLQNVGQIELTRFANDAGLEARGDNLFMETPASGTAVTGIAGEENFGTIEQGVLELSNVNIVSEITKMITAQRAYEMNSKVIQSSDDMMSTLTNIR
ncbi:MAG TPA: flagellar basal-body rod protein FlgG [Alphaproteobacteria bacterium]